MRRQQLQIQKQVSKKDYRLFLETIAQLERYIEIAGYYWDWGSRKWIHDNTIKRKDVISDSKKAEELFLNQLFALSKGLEDMPSFFREELKEDFRRWVDTTRINVNNCPPKLKHFLFEFNEILEGHGKKIQREKKKSSDDLDFDSSECMEQLNKRFSGLQTSVQGEREIQWSRGSRFFYRDLELKNKLSTDAEQGKEAFKQIAKSVASKHFGFHYFAQKDYQLSISLNPYQIIQEIDQNPQSWRLDEIITEIGYGGTKKREFILIRRGAREDNFDLAGKLKFTNNSLYKWESFSAYQKFQIKKALKISVNYLTEDEIKWVFKEDPRIWKVGKIEGQTYLIHNSARIRKEEIGTLIHSQQKFSEEEWSKIEKALKNCFLTKKFNFVSFANKEFSNSNVKELDNKKDSKESEGGYKWPTCKAISCNKGPDYWVDYCSYHQKCLDKLREYESSINDIRELETFKTWFNGNCGYAINYDYSSSSEHPFYIWIVVYEPAHKGMSEILKTFAIKDSYDNLESAKNRASSLRIDLNGENPILAIVSRLTLRFNEGYSFEKAGVKKFDFPSNAINNPDQYIRPLDIVKVRKRMFIYPFEHVGIYLGNKQVVHIWDPSDTKSTSGNLTRINSWSDFLKNRTNLPTRYHSILPFKKHDKIVKQIARTVVARYGEGEYNALHNNCEHYSFMVIYSIKFSPQAKARLNFIEEMAEREKARGPYDPYATSLFYEHDSYNWCDSSTFFDSFELKSKINEVDQELNNLVQHKTYEVESAIRKIKNYDENQWEKLIEIPSKNNCKIM